MDRGVLIGHSESTMRLFLLFLKVVYMFVRLISKCVLLFHNSCKLLSIALVLQIKEDGISYYLVLEGKFKMVLI